jgi:glycerate kinase
MFRVAVLASGYKDNLSNDVVCQCLVDGFRAGWRKDPLSLQITSCPVGDGGLGTAQALAAPLELKEQSRLMLGPLLENKLVRYYFNTSNRVAMFDSAEIVGLHCLRFNQRNPLITSS